MSSFLVIPRLHVQTANAKSTYWIINGAPITAAISFVHNMGLKCDFVEEIEGVALIHHDSELQCDRDSNGQLAPHQRRGSGLIDEKDYAGTGSMSLGLQPTTTRHITVSLIVKLDDDARFNEQSLENFISTARFCGGQVVSHGKHNLCESIEELSKAIPAGFWVADRQDLLQNSESDPSRKLLKILAKNSTFYYEELNRTITQEREILAELKTKEEKKTEEENNPISDNEKFLNLIDKKLIGDKQNSNFNVLQTVRFAIKKATNEATGTQSKDPKKLCAVSGNLIATFEKFMADHSWISAACIGYSCLTEFEKREYVRENKEHAYVEPLVGMTQYRTTRSIDFSTQNIFWKEKWLDDSTYTITQF